MNGSNPIPLLGPVGGGILAPSGQIPGHEGDAFADSLSAALSASLGAAVMPTPTPLVSQASSIELPLSRPPAVLDGNSAIEGAARIESANGSEGGQVLLAAEPGSQYESGYLLGLMANRDQPMAGPEQTEPPVGNMLVDPGKLSDLPSISLVDGMMERYDQVKPPATDFAPVFGALPVERGVAEPPLQLVSEIQQKNGPLVIAGEPESPGSAELEPRPQISAPAHPWQQGIAGDVPERRSLLPGANPRDDVPSVALGQPETSPSRSTRPSAVGNADIVSTPQVRMVAHEPNERLQIPSAYAAASKVKAAEGATITAGGAKDASKPIVSGVVQTQISSQMQISGDLPLTDLRLTTGGIDVDRFEPFAGSPVKPLAQTAQPASTQIALQIVRSIPQGVDRMSVQLHPVELGSVEIRLDFGEDGRVNALITAERPETLDMLQRDSRTLERSLNDTGLKLANDGLSFSLKQDQQQQQGQGFNTPDHHRAQAYQTEQGHDGSADTEPAATPVHVTGLRLLDIST